MKRTQTKQIHVGPVAIGGGAPVAVQSMCNTHTSDARATIEQIARLHDAGCEIIRLAVPDQAAADALPEIVHASPIPVVAAIHFDYRLALAAAKAGVHKIRINPGNIGEPDNVRKVAEACRERGIPIRIGVNGGSLEKHILAKYGAPVPEAMVESALYHVRLLEKFDFNNIVISIKNSNVPRMMEAYRQLSAVTDYPLHVGVTEAGTYQMGLLKSGMGIGGMLLEGIGDTIRVSLAAEPEKVARAEEMLADITAYLRKFYPTIHINENNISESFELLWREALEFSELKLKKYGFDKAKEVYEDADEVIGAFLQKIGQTPHPDRVKQLKDIHEQLIRYHAAYEELEKASSKLKEFEESNADVQAAAAEAAGTQMRSKEEIQAEKQKLETDISDTERAIRAYEKQMEELRERAGSVEDAKERLEQLAEEKEELAHRYDVVDKTKQYLSQAKENLTARYRDPIMNGFNKYYEMLTGCLPKEYKMDANISLTKEESGGRRQITALSSGWQDLVNICLRMALVDAMYKEEKPFLVMDDPFVNLDKEKMELAKGFLRAISKEYQVLYFTCHESRI